MASQTINSEDLSLNDVLNDFYVVPSYQREYVWETDQVEKLLQDINTEFAEGRGSGESEYFIGSLVVCPSPEGTFELIDGQQRMTTAMILLCAIRDHLKAHGAQPSQALERRIADADIDAAGRDIFRYRVTLQYEDSHDVLERMAAGVAGFTGTDEATRSIENILNAYRVVRTFLEGEFGDDEAATKAFYAYLMRDVKLIRIRTLSVAHALKVFETINDRGVGLDSMDLLKNLLFMRADRDDFERLKDEWKKLVDTLFLAREKPLRFLRYFIFASYKVDRLREDEIYNWFTENEQTCGFREDPIRFARGLLRAAEAYAYFIGGKDAEGKPNRYLMNLSYLSGSARQHLILLLAGRFLPPDLFSELCRHIENLFFAYIITREPTRDFESRFAQWAPELREVTDRPGLDSFIARRITPSKNSLAARFALAFDELSESSLQKYRTRYVLARLTQRVNEEAWGSSGSASDIRTFINNEVDVEHILPRHPAAEVVASFDMPDQLHEFVPMLGNLTLVEKTINCSVGNGLFSEKKAAYKQSNFLLTKSLGERVSVGSDTAVNRAVAGLEEFDEWTSDSVRRRQRMLAALAHEAWDMPRGSGQ